MENSCNYDLLNKIYDIAAAEIGVSESENADRIIEYEKSTTLPFEMLSEKTAWCSCFVSWVLEKAGCESTSNAWATSYLGWGSKIDIPIKGCVVVLSRGAEQGHVAFFSHREGKLIYVLGGNQGNKVCVAPYPVEHLLGYRVPKELV